MFRLGESTFEAFRNLCLLSLAGALLYTSGAAQSDPSDTASEPLQVVTTVGMLADTTERVGGRCVDTRALMGPGVDPHLYQARASDVAALDRAELILYIGLTLEGQLGDVLARFARRVPTVAVADQAVPPAARLADPDFESGHDPHVWMDPLLWSEAAVVIADAVTELRPECASEIRAATEEFRAEAQALHDWIAAAVATIPAERRVLITAHDAFGYYGHAFGLEVVGIQGISTEAEPSIADIREVADLLIERQVPALFLESTIGPRTVQAVLDAARDRGHDARLGGTLYGDAMGEAGTPEGTWIGMLHANTIAIVSALGGTVPPLPTGLHGWADRQGVPY